MENKKQEKSQPQMLRYALLRKKNKRIEILALKDHDGSVVICILAKRLIGSWKERRIIIAEVSYGIESFLVINDVFSMLIGDPLFMKEINKEIGQIQKDRMTCQTNIKK